MFFTFPENAHWNAARCVEAYYLQRTQFESIAERKLRRRQLTEDGNVEISGRLAVSLSWKLCRQSGKAWGRDGSIPSRERSAVHDHDFAEMAAALEMAVGCLGLGKAEPDYALSSAIKPWYETGPCGCFCEFERWRATRCNFKRGSASPSLRFVTEQRISAGRR